MREALGRYWRTWSERPFPALLLHFAGAIARASDNPEIEISISGILGLLAVPGAMLSFTLLDKYSSLLRWIRGHREADALLTSIPDKYFFIVFSMAVTGVAAALRWDRIFPGRLDFLNLGPLPVSLRAVFAANLCAMLAVAGIFAVTVNAASSILFPGIVTASQMEISSFASFAAIHAGVVVAASLFAFFACLAVMGILMAVLPHRWFQRISLYARILMIVALLGLLATSFSVPAQLRGLSPESPLFYLPPVWFLGLYQSLQHRASPALEHAGDYALPALAAVFCAAMLAYAISYRRHFASLPESSASRAPGGRGRWSTPEWFLNTPLLDACVPFGLKTLARSESHSLIVGAFCGLGLVAAAQTLSEPGAAAVRHAPYMIAYLLICGIRFSFEFPAGVRANWIFQTTMERSADQCPAVGRRVMFLLLLPAVVAPTAVLSGPVHAAWILALSGLLGEALLVGYRKIPFTCPSSEFGSHVTMAFAGLLVGFFLFTYTGAAIEQWAGGHPGRLLGAVAALGACHEVIRRLKVEIGPRDLQFEPGPQDEGSIVAG